MSVTVDLIAQHSGSKDHLAMTGGTLSADKVVRGDGPLVLQHEFFPVAVVAAGSTPEERVRVYSGIHSIEHALASPEGGDLRARIGELMSGGTGGGGGERKGDIARQLVDMSPYVPGLLDADSTSDVVIGFRSTFVNDEEALPREVIAEAYDRSLRLIRELFAGGGAVPFSTPEACGQYDLHSAAAGVELIDGARGVSSDGVKVGMEPGVGVGARELYVCDLRLVKPRLPEAYDQRVLDVLGGHYISQAVEAEAWKFLGGGQPGTVAAGNFGCSTGEYLMVGNPGGFERSELLRQAHVAVGKTLAGLAAYEGDGALRSAAASDARFALDHVARHRPEIAELAEAG